jgi:glycosyltransferase involved in cell wall biosynthesis
MKNLVSIITPCYNGENYVHRLLDSVLNQTYSNIEFIFVNDGSTDKTEKIVLGYKNKFDKRGIKLIYIYQENMGVSCAINKGLKQVNGEYLSCPDSDDYLELQSIEKRVEILEKYPEYAVVTSDTYIRSINDLDNYIKLAASNKPEMFVENQFELLLTGNSMFIPGTHLMRMSSFDKVHKDRHIFPYRKGQNWQLLLPLYFEYKRYFLDEPLFNYIKYQSSITADYKTERDKLMRCQEHEETIIATLNSIDMAEDLRKKYIFGTKIRYTRERLTLAFQLRDMILFKEQYNILKEKRHVNRKERVYNIVMKNLILYQIFNLLSPFFNKLIKISLFRKVLYNKK